MCRVATCHPQAKKNTWSHHSIISSFVKKKKLLFWKQFQLLSDRNFTQEESEVRAVPQNTCLPTYFYIWKNNESNNGKRGQQKILDSNGIFTLWTLRTSLLFKSFSQWIICCLSVTLSGDVCEEQRAGSAHSGAARHGGGELRRADGGRGKNLLNPHK